MAAAKDAKEMCCSSGFLLEFDGIFILKEEQKPH